MGRLRERFQLHRLEPAVRVRQGAGHAGVLLLRRDAVERLGRPSNSGCGRKGFGEGGTPFEQEKDPLIKREPLELVRVRKRIFGMVKAVGVASHAEVLGASKGRKTWRPSS